MRNLNYSLFEAYLNERILQKYLCIGLIRKIVARLGRCEALLSLFTLITELS